MKRTFSCLIGNPTGTQMEIMEVYKNTFNETPILINDPSYSGGADNGFYILRFPNAEVWFVNDYKESTPIAIPSFAGGMYYNDFGVVKGYVANTPSDYLLQFTVGQQGNNNLGLVHVVIKRFQP